MPLRLVPDDEVYRYRAVWLGPEGFSFPFKIRYIAYALGLVNFLVILLVEAITPIPVGIPPVWELCLAVIATYAIMLAVDHDRPIGSLAANLRNTLRYHPDTTTSVRVTPRLGSFVKTTQEPIHG